MSRNLLLSFGKDSDAIAFISAASITNDTQKLAINNLVLDLKRYGIWTKLRACYPFVGGSADSHKYNLKSPVSSDASFRIIFSGTITHDSNGITPDGSTGYGDTRLNGSAQGLNNDSHLSVYVRTNTAAGDKTEINAYNGLEAYWSIKVRDAGDVTFNGIYRFTGNGFITVSGNTDSRGFYILTRRSSSDAESYKNGVTTGTTTVTAQSIPNVNVHIGKRSDTNTSFTDRNIAFASIGQGLTDTEASNFYTAVQRFQTTLGRQI